MLPAASDRSAGTLPAEWGNVTLTTFTYSLSSNQLSGALPATWDALIWHAAGLKLTDNVGIQGPVPATWLQANDTFGAAGSPHLYSLGLGCVRAWCGVGRIMSWGWTCRGGGRFVGLPA